MAESMQIPATLVIDPELLRVIITDSVRVAMSGIMSNARPLTHEDQGTVASPGTVGHELQGAKPPRKRRARKTEPEAEKTPEPEAPEKVLRIRVDPNLPFVQQVHAVIVDAAMQTHGDAIARSIIRQWNPAADSGIEVLRSIYPAVTLELIGAAVSDAQEATLRGLPALFLNGIFAIANEYAAKATKTKVCGTCEGVEAHKPGCPALLAERRGTDENGGAIPARVRNPTPNQPTAPAEPQGEQCLMGGPGSGCPIPAHYPVRQGGTHVYFHPKEVADKFRAALAPAARPEPHWNAPPPPGAARPPAAPKKRGGRGKKAKS